MEQSVFCGECKNEVPDDTHCNPRNPCPNCGGLSRHIAVVFSEKIEVHSAIRGKVRSGPGKKGISQEFFSGDQPRISKGDWVEKERFIDRANNRYFEKVVDKTTGEVVHYKDHPLSEHRGHGSAKFKKDEPTVGEG